MTTTFTLTTRTVRMRRFEEYERDAAGFPIVSDTISSVSTYFPDREGVLQFLMTTLGMESRRANLVIDRACEFEADPWTPLGPNRETILHRVTKSEA